MTTTPLDPALEVHIDLSACTGKHDLLDRFAAALRFPSWFGHNWDAMRKQQPELLASALQVLADAAAFWADEGIAFTVDIIEDAQPGADAEASS